MGYKVDDLFYCCFIAKYLIGFGKIEHRLVMNFCIPPSFYFKNKGCLLKEATSILSACMVFDSHGG